MSENDMVTTRPARGLYFYLKVLFVSGALLAVAGGIAVYYVYHRLTTDSRLEQMVMEKVSSAISMDVKFEKLAVVFPGIEISNVTVATDSANLKVAAKISQINIRPDLWAAFAGELLIDALTVASATTAIELKKFGADAQQAAGGPASGAFDLANIKFPFNSVELHALKFSIVDQSSGQSHELLVNNAGLSRSMLSTSIPFNFDAVLVGRAKLNVDGKLYWPTNVVADLVVKAENIEELKKLVPDKYRKHTQAIKSAEVKASIKYGISDGSLVVESCLLKAEPGLQADGQMQFSSLSPLNGSASFKIAPMAVDDLWPAVKGFVPSEQGLVLSSGRISAGADLSVVNGVMSQNSIEIIPENIEVTAKALPSKVQLGRGKIRYDEGRVTFAGFEARMSDTLIKMPNGSLIIDPLAFNGELAAEVDLDSVWRLASSYLSADAKRIVPSGKAAFSGKIAYDKKGVKVDGTLNSEQIKLKEQKTSAQATIERVRVHFDSISPNSGQIKIESLEIKGVGASVKVDGTIKNAADMGFDLTAAGSLSVDEFSRLASSLFKLPVRAGQFKGDLALDLKVGGTVSNPKPKGRIEFKNLHADFAERGLVISNLNGLANAEMDKLVVDKLSAELLGGKLSISGSLNNFKKPVADAKATISGADLAAIRKLIKINFPAMSEEIEFSGNTDLNVTLTGPVAEPIVKGEAELRACRFNHPAVLRPIENISGPITFTNSGLNTTKVTADWGSSKVVVNGSLKNWAKFITDFKFVVDPLDVTDAAGFFLKDTGYKVEGRGTGSGSITGAVETIKVEGVASVPVGVFAAPVSQKGDMFKFPFKNLLAKAVYFDKIFNVSSADLELFSGKVAANGKVFVDKNPITFEFETKMTKVMTEQFLAENTTHKDVVQGGLDGTFAAKGNTTGLVSMNGNASLLMQKGFYNSPPFVKQISQQLGAPQLASGPIDNVAGDYVIAGGRITSKNTMAKSKDGKVTFLGSVGLDATLDGEAQIQIKREACQQSDILRQLVGNSESLDIPVTLKGSFMSPSVGLPIDRMLRDVVERRAKDAIKNEAGKALGKLFGIKSGGSSAPAPTPVPVLAPSLPADPATTASPTAPSDGLPAGSMQTPETAPQVATPAQPVPETKQEKIENKIKDVGKELKKLKNIFKF